MVTQQEPVPRRAKIGYTPDHRIWLRAELDMPPTDNLIYLNKAAGQGRILLKPGSAYKTSVQAQIADVVIKQGNARFPKNVPYSLTLRVYFKHVFNKKWIEDPSGARFAKIDSSNRIKLIQDAITSSLDFDDSHIFENLIYKHEDETNPRIDALLVQLEHPLSVTVRDPYVQPKRGDIFTVRAAPHVVRVQVTRITTRGEVPVVHYVVQDGANETKHSIPVPIWTEKSKLLDLVTRQGAK